MHPRNSHGLIPRAMIEAAAGIHARLKACNSERRLEIMILLMGRDMRVSDLAKAMMMDLPTISHHLAVLKRDGLVYARAESNERIYGLSKILRVRRTDNRWELSMALEGGATVVVLLPAAAVAGDMQQHSNALAHESKKTSEGSLARVQAA